MVRLYFYVAEKLHNESWRWARYKIHQELYDLNRKKNAVFENGTGTKQCRRYQWVSKLLCFNLLHLIFWFTCRLFCSIKRSYTDLIMFFQKEKQLCLYHFWVIYFSRWFLCFILHTLSHINVRKRNIPVIIWRNSCSILEILL